MKDRPQLESLDPDLDLTFPKVEGEVRFRVWSKGLSFKHSKVLWIKIPR